MVSKIKKSEKKARHGIGGGCISAARGTSATALIVHGEIMTSTTSRAATVSASATKQTKSVSESNRNRLEKICAKAGYTNVNFWVPPQIASTEDELIADVAGALEKFHEASEAGLLKPDNDEPC